MNLQNLTISSTSDLHVLDSLNVALLGFNVKKGANTTTPNDNTLVVYVDKQPSSNPSNERRQYIFELDDVLKYYNQVSDEFTLKVAISNNDVIFNAYVERKIGENNSILVQSEFEEVDGIPVVLFEGENYIYTNYTNAEITAIYPKDNDESSLLLLTSIFAGHRKDDGGDFTLDDIYFKDAFTQTGDDLNLEVNEVSVDSITSNDNKFSLDDDGNLIVKSVTATNSINASSIISNNNSFSLDSNGNLNVTGLTVNGTPITGSGSGGGQSLNTSDVCNIVYPINSIYLSVSNVNPATLFGGIWVQLKDRFLLGAGDTYTNGDIGGEATHALTTSEMPSHNHQQSWTGNDGRINDLVTSASGGSNTNRERGTGSGVRYYAQSAWQTSAKKVGTGFEGSGDGHNNMPPYLVVYMWKRTA